MSLSAADFQEARSAVIQVGYTQQDSNDEGLVDFGDALRIVSEQDDYDFGKNKVGWLADLDETQRAELEVEFNRDFGIKAAVPGSPSFWNDLKYQFGIL